MKYLKEMKMVSKLKHLFYFIYLHTNTVRSSYLGQFSNNRNKLNKELCFSLVDRDKMLVTWDDRLKNALKIAKTPKQKCFENVFYQKPQQMCPK